MLAGLCHDVDHPGFNNNFLALCKHPLAKMYRSSMLEYHHYFLAKKIIEVIPYKYIFTHTLTSNYTTTVASMAETSVHIDRCCNSYWLLPESASPFIEERMRNYFAVTKHIDNNEKKSAISYNSHCNTQHASQYGKELIMLFINIIIIINEIFYYQT